MIFVNKNDSLSKPLDNISKKVNIFFNLKTINMETGNLRPNYPTTDNYSNKRDLIFKEFILKSPEEDPDDAKEDFFHNKRICFGFYKPSGTAWKAKIAYWVAIELISKEDLDKKISGPQIIKLLEVANYFHNGTPVSHLTGDTLSGIYGGIEISFNGEFNKPHADKVTTEELVSHLQRHLNINRFATGDPILEPIVY